MIIETKFEVGHTYWVPRSHKRRIEKQELIDGEVWKCETYHFEASCKRKEIISIKIYINQRSSVQVQYMTVDYGKYHQLSQCYNEEDISFNTEEEAYEIAKNWASQKLEYFGN